MFQGVELSLETTCCGLACTVSGWGYEGQSGAKRWSRVKLHIWEFPKIRVPYLGVPILRILLFRVLY